MPGTVEGIVNNIIDRGSRPMAGAQYERIKAIDEVLDTVRALLYQAASLSDELAMIDNLREPMGRVDRDTL
jgi:hypothetical protein